MRVAVIQLGYGDDEGLAARTLRVGRAGARAAGAPPGRAARAIGAVLHAGSIIERPADEPGPEGRGLWNTSALLDPHGEQLARAVENQCFVVAANTAGTYAGHQMGGHSAVIAPDGQVLAEAGTGQEVLSVDLDPARVPELRAAFPVLRDWRLRVSHRAAPLDRV